MISGEVALVRGALVPTGSWKGRRPPVRQLAEAMLRGDTGEAGDLAERFLARAGSRAAVFADLLQPAQYQVGELWYSGRIGVDDEQRAAVVLEGLVRMVPATPVHAGVPAGSRCVLAVLAGERHTLGLGMFALALEDDGWEVELADAGCQPHDLLAMVERVRPRLVGISAGCLPSLRCMTKAVGAIRERAVPVLVGGSAFNRAGDLWRRVGATAHGADPRIGTVLARRLLRP